MRASILLYIVFLAVGSAVRVTNPAAGVYLGQRQLRATDFIIKTATEKAETCKDLTPEECEKLRQKKAEEREKEREARRAEKDAQRAKEREARRAEKDKELAASGVVMTEARAAAKAARRDERDQERTKIVEEKRAQQDKDREEFAEERAGWREDMKLTPEERQAQRIARREAMTPEERKTLRTIRQGRVDCTDAESCSKKKLIGVFTIRVIGTGKKCIVKILDSREKEVEEFGEFASTDAFLSYYGEPLCEVGDKGMAVSRIHASVLAEAAAKGSKCIAAVEAYVSDPSHMTHKGSEVGIGDLSAEAEGEALAQCPT